MGNKITEWFSHAADIFSRNKRPDINTGSGSNSSTDNGRGGMSYYGHGGERTIIQSIYTRFAVDAASYSIRNVVVDPETDTIKKYNPSSIDDIFNFSANIDQTGRAFIQDIVSSMLNDGVIAIVPVDTDITVEDDTSVFKINSARVGRIVTWYPQAVDVELYNDKIGVRQTIHIEKKNVCIVQNPFYATMNRHNSTVKRLVHKMNLLDVIDQQSASGKLDIIVQLPYTIKSEARQQQADERKRRIEAQMAGSKYGVAYIDAAEKITQLNRPAENNLMNQVEYLTRMLYGQLGITDAILDGSADEATMLSYFNRVIEPLLAPICLEVERSWISKNSRTRGSRMRIIRDPLRYVTASALGEMLEGLSRNEVFSSDEARILFGRLPMNTERSSALLNKQIADNAESTAEEDVEKKEESDGSEEI